MRDVILIRGLQVEARVGVTDSERQRPQRLEVDAEIFPARPFHELGDEVVRTVDYDRVCRRLREFAAASSWNLIESLASGMARTVLAEFPAAGVTIQIRKFVLPGVGWVGVRHSASRE